MAIHRSATPRRQFLSFDGQSSKDYLLYLSGPGVYDSPEPDVEAISIPGLNGDLIQNNARSGYRRFQNVDIKYKAFFFNGLPAKTAAVKSWLLSPTGYCKLQDTYDPDFFRMAVCTSALAFDVSANQRAAEMELTFNCKPQRWSVAGQEPIELSSNDIAVLSDGSIDLLAWAANHSTLNTGYYLDAAGVEVKSDANIIVSGYMALPCSQITYGGQWASESYIGTYGTYSIFCFDADKTFLGGAYLLGDVVVSLEGLEALTYTVPDGTVYVRIQYESGYEAAIIATSSGAYCCTINNPYLFYAQPIIRVYGEITDEMIILIGNNAVTLYSGASSDDDYTSLDCELQNAYDSSGGFVNDIIYSDEFPVLAPGDNAIVWNRNVTKIEIIPRWWTL